MYSETNLTKLHVKHSLATTWEKEKSKTKERLVLNSRRIVDPGQEQNRLEDLSLPDPQFSSK